MYTVTWNGPGIIDPSGVYDPGASTSGTTVLVTVEQDGCQYKAAFDIAVQPQPVADFEIRGTPCVDELLDVFFTGSASSSAMFAWDLDGADTMAAAPPALFAITWPEAGDYRVQLIVTDNGCPSEARAVPITIDAPLPVPEPQCEVEDYYTVTVSWPPVPGATGYQVGASAGRVSVAGTTCTIHQLDDDTPVTISVTATGPTACGPSTATIECRTIPYIPPLTYVPTVFSPNGDGVNDVFFVQANEEIVAVSAMRVFDRWGDVLFEKFDALPNDPDAGWDGTFHGQPMNPDVFVYWIEVLTVKGQTITLTGDVTILR
jgi:gliding motility-associated-like protein